MAKLFVGDTVVEIVLACQRVMGAYGCAESYDMERYVRDIAVLTGNLIRLASNRESSDVRSRFFSGCLHAR
jgi:alkylation response protein AidB-like acyl-CoA dehydrogenase